MIYYVNWIIYVYVSRKPCNDKDQKMSDASSIRHVKVQLQVIQQKKKKIYRAVHRAYPV